MRPQQSACALAAALLSAAAASANDIDTSFEFADTFSEFTLGTSPNTATFTNGFVDRLFIPGLYRSGVKSWMVDFGDTGTVAFETAAESVDFWFRDQSTGNDSVVTVLDTNGDPIQTFNGTTTFQNVNVTSPAKGAAIGSVTVENNGASGVVAIDDFVYCAGAAGPSPIEDPLPDIQPGDVHVTVETVATGLVAPNWGAYAPLSGAEGAAAAEDRLFVSDQTGVIYAIDLMAGTKSVFLDAASLLVPLGVAGPGTFDERGLLGFAFHPDYQTNGLLYTYTSEPTTVAADFPAPEGAAEDHHSVIREWIVADPTNPDSTAAMNRTLLRVGQPQFNHNAGAMSFGPDGLLYVAFGDGGAADDQGAGHTANGNGQDPTNLLGSIIRIDPLGSNSANGQYGIPASNPFAGDPNNVEEIFVYGLRNPFRFSFDQVLGDLYIADVGQNDIEELNRQRVVEGLSPGVNFGWRCKEGSFFFDPNGAAEGFVTDTPPHTVPPDLVDPIAEYDHDDGISIIGGFVYRGVKIDPLQGVYVLGEFARTFASDGRLFFLDESGAEPQIREFQLVGQSGLGLFLLGFGQDAAGEVYALANGTGTPFPDGQGENTGVVLRIAIKTGDLNADGVTDGADLGLLLQAWDPTGASAPSSADLNMDGVVDGADLGILLQGWGV